MRAIGIDIGTTAVCGVAVDTETGKVLRSVTKNSEAFLRGCAEWEKIQSVEKIMALADGILEELFTEDTVSIGVTGQMHGILYLDLEGRAVSPLYIWQDGRGNLPYKSTTYAAHLGSHSGYGNVTDFYNRENGIRPQEAVTYCTVHDYFVMRLTGRKSPILHASDAASLGCYDMEKNAFTYPCPAEVTEKTCVVGEWRGVPVGVAIGDNQASVFGAVAEEGAVLVNVGTGSQVSAVTAEPVVSDALECRPFVEGRYLAVGAALCGGRAYAMLEALCREVFRLGTGEDREMYSILDILEAPAHETVTVDTRFAGTRRDPLQKGGIFGITQENFTLADLKQGFLYGIAAELHGMFCEAGLSCVSLVGSGNGLRKNPALVGAAEELFGQKMRIPCHKEEAAFGAALFGLAAKMGEGGIERVRALIRYED